MKDPSIVESAKPLEHDFLIPTRTRAFVQRRRSSEGEDERTVVMIVKAVMIV